MTRDLNVTRHRLRSCVEKHKVNHHTLNGRFGDCADSCHYILKLPRPCTALGVLGNPSPPVVPRPATASLRIPSATGLLWSDVVITLTDKKKWSCYSLSERGAIGCAK
jgi:hypothetical protein